MCYTMFSGNLNFIRYLLDSIVKENNNRCMIIED